MASIKNCFQLRTLNICMWTRNWKNEVIDKNEWKHHILTLRVAFLGLPTVAHNTVAHIRCGNNSLARRNDVHRQKNKHCDTNTKRPQLNATITTTTSKKWHQSEEKKNERCERKRENWTQLFKHYTYTCHLLTSESPRRSPRNISESTIHTSNALHNVCTWLPFEKLFITNTNIFRFISPIAQQR